MLLKFLLFLVYDLEGLVCISGNFFPWEREAVVLNSHITVEMLCSTEQGKEVGVVINVEIRQLYYQVK